MVAILLVVGVCCLVAGYERGRLAQYEHDMAEAAAIAHRRRIAQSNALPWLRAGR